MKSFSRSYPGKFILFLLCVCSLLGIIASVVGMIFLWGSDAYSYDYESYCRSNIQTIFLNDAYQYTEEIINHPEYIDDTTTGLRFGLFKNDECIYLSPSADIDSLSKENIYSCDMSELFPDAYDSSSTAILTVYTFKGYLDESFKGIDNYFFMNKLSQLYYLQTEIYFICIGFALLFFFTYFALLCVSARRPKSEEFFPGPFHRVPFDILFAISGAIVILIAILADSVSGSGVNLSSVYYTITAAIYYSVACAVISVLFVGLSMSFAARVKDKSLISGLLICKIFLLAIKLLRRLFTALRGFIRAVPLIWRGILIYLGISVGELLLMMRYEYYCFDMFVLCKAILFPFVAYGLIMLKGLKIGAEAMAKGDMEHKVDTSKMVLDFKQHGENLNSIGDGMSIAVEEKLKSERMKTELITNVSHDIKTPLTSIINYSDLISKEQCDNEKIKEYSKILLRQSERLKRLIADLVEASKASTGNLEVELSPADGGVMLSQLCGEYEDKLAECGLKLVTNKPDSPVIIMADGRRMMRVFDNLMNNIAKYSLPGTRVYVSLERLGDTAVFSFKNTSRDPLNVSPDELMERFVRGDSSRHTDGNGLGLSIARSLTELQNGHFDISIDGDLFKASLSFPVIG